MTPRVPPWLKDRNTSVINFVENLITNFNNKMKSSGWRGATFTRKTRIYIYFFGIYTRANKSRLYRLEGDPMESCAQT